MFPTVRPAEAHTWTQTRPKVSQSVLFSPQMYAGSHLNSINLVPKHPSTSLTAIYHAPRFHFPRPIIFNSSQQLWHCGFVSINEQALVCLMHHSAVKPNYATLSIHAALNGHTHTLSYSRHSWVQPPPLASRLCASAHIHASRHTHPSNKNPNPQALSLTLRSSQQSLLFQPGRVKLKWSVCTSREYLSPGCPRPQCPADKQQRSALSTVCSAYNCAGTGSLQLQYSANRGSQLLGKAVMHKPEGSVSSLPYRIWCLFKCFSMKFRLWITGLSGKGMQMYHLIKIRDSVGIWNI